MNLRIVETGHIQHQLSLIHLISIVLKGNLLLTKINYSIIHLFHLYNIFIVNCSSDNGCQLPVAFVNVLPWMNVFICNCCLFEFTYSVGTIGVIRYINQTGSDWKQKQKNGSKVMMCRLLVQHYLICKFIFHCLCYQIYVMFVAEQLMHFVHECWRQDHIGLMSLNYMAYLCAYLCAHTL